MADLGALAGGFMRAFAAARNGKKERETDEKYKKAMTMMLEAQVEQAQRQGGARTKVNEMMSPQAIPATPPQFQFPEQGQLGEIQTTKPAGPMVRPGMSFLDIMSDPQGKIAMLESGLGEQMQHADQLTAQSELVRAMQTSDMPALDFIKSPQGAALAVRAGMNPSEFLRASQSDVTGALDGLKVQLAGLDIANKQRDLDQSAVDRERGRATRQNTVQRGIEQAGHVVELAKSLEGSMLKAGLPASSWRRTAASVMEGVGSAAGLDTSQLRRDISSFDQLKKSLADQLINLMSSGDLGQGTNNKLQQYQNALASPETSPGAVLAIQANIAQTLLDEADVQGFEIQGRDGIEASIKQWREYERPQGEPVVDGPAIADQAANTARDAGRQGLQVAMSTLDELAAGATAAGGRISEASSSAKNRAGAEIDRLKGVVSDEDIRRAKDLVRNGTEESLLAARGLLGRALEAGQRRAGAQIREVANMSAAELKGLATNAAAMTPEMLEAAAARWDEVNSTATAAAGNVQAMTPGMLKAASSGWDQVNSATTAAAGNVQAMTPEMLKAAAERWDAIKAMSPDMLEAAAARWNEIHNAATRN